MNAYNTGLVVLNKPFLSSGVLLLFRVRLLLFVDSSVLPARQSDDDRRYCTVDLMKICDDDAIFRIPPTYRYRRGMIRRSFHVRSRWNVLFHY